MTKRQRPPKERDLVLLPLGGTGEIGMNCYAYGEGVDADREWLIVDLGVKFGSDSEPGIDVILPDIGFLSGQKKKVAGLVLTHAHEDHIGAVPWLWPQLRCSIFCTAFTAALLEHKLAEHALEEEAKITVVPPGGAFQAGGFKLRYVNLTHSIPEPQGLLIETPSGRVFHSGDWKIDARPIFNQPLDEAALQAIGAEGLDVLVCDSTNVLREGFSPSESDVAETLMDIVGKATGRVAITTFASHVERISSAVRAARAAGREVVIAGRAMHRTIEAARACGYLKDAGVFLDEEEFGYLPPDRIMLLCTGSQGEPRAAIARIAEDQHPHVALEKGDLVIFSSRTIPGNEREVAAVLNNLAALDVDIVTADDALVHTSGHPRQGELSRFYGWLKPRALIPMHGEARHLREHARFARSCGLSSLMPKDGHLIRLAPGTPIILDEVRVGRLHVDGHLVVPADDGPARQRRKLMFSGIVMAVVAVAENLQLSHDIEVLADGLPAGLQDDLAEAAEEAFDSLPKPRRRDDVSVEDAVRQAVRRKADHLWGKKPVCKVVVLRT
jgi:ribonuclease J